MEASLHLFLKSGEHLIEVAHPYESVDADAFLAACEGRVEQTAFASVLKVEQGRLYTEKNGGVGTKHVVVHVARKLNHPA